MIIALVGRKNGQEGSAHQNLGDVIVNFAKAILKKNSIVMFENETAANFKDLIKENIAVDHHSVRTGSTYGISQIADVVIVFGGDGTMVSAAKDFAEARIPLLGVNLGRLGFISDVPSDFDVDTIIEMILMKDYDIDRRIMIAAEGVNALNDIVISRSSGRILEFEVSIDDEYAYRARADGLIVATPTGSTAYCMSAGGSVVSPNAKVLQVVPMFSQTLSCRPLIICENSVVSFKLIYGDATFYADGNHHREVEQNETITIKLARIKDAERYSPLPKLEAHLMHPKIPNLTYSYYNTLREKLNWQHLPGTPR